MELQCPDPGCAFGEEGGRYKTEKIDQHWALQMMTMHVHHLYRIETRSSGLIRRGVGHVPGVGMKAGAQGWT